MNLQIDLKTRLIKILIYTVLIIFCIVCIIPFLLLVSISFSDEVAISRFGYSLIPLKFTTYAYQYILVYPDVIANAYVVSILVTVLGTAMSLTVTAMAAYALSRSSLKYKNHISFYIFFTMLFNGGMVSWYIVTSQLLHLRENIFALIVPYLANAWYIMIMRNFFKSSVPEALIESVKIEGGGEFRAFWQVALPVSLPGLATVALFTTLAYWNDWYLGLMLITANQKIVPLQLYMHRIMSTLQYLQSDPQALNRGITVPGESARMAVCVLAIGPIIFVYPFFQKYFVKGLTVGSVKG